MRTLAIAWLTIATTSIAGCATTPSRQADSTAASQTDSPIIAKPEGLQKDSSKVARRVETSPSIKDRKAGETSAIRQVNSETDADAGGIHSESPASEPERQSLPINLASALQLSSARPIDVEVATERIRAASAQLDLARAAWLPTITLGGDYNRHDGPIQDVSGQIVNADRSSMMLGLGSGFGTAAVFSPNDAIFGPLVACQLVAARTADAQAASNNSMLAVTDAYFNVEQARGELVGAVDATRRAEDVVRRVKKLATGLVSPLEVARAETHLARRRAAESSAREREQVAGAELARLLRLNATAQLELLEPPELQVQLIDEKKSVDELVVVGLTNRPELASNQAQVQATLTLLRQEKLRPVLPSILLRGASTPVTGTLGAGFFGGGTNGSIGSAGLRDDFDLQFLWQFDNLGFGNRARIKGRESELRIATWELFRTQDRVAAEVAAAHAQAREARRRIELAGAEAKLALESYDNNLEALGQIRRSGELVQTIVRPQEVVAAVQDLWQAYSNYYGAVADSNRAQFRLYRALGQPARDAVLNETEPTPPSQTSPVPPSNAESPPQEK